jgi:hypothetical protein
MSTVLPGIKDRYRNKRNRKRRYVGQVLCFDASGITCLAEVYGDTLEEMRRRKHAVAVALNKLECERS